MSYNNRKNEEPLLSLEDLKKYYPVKEGIIEKTTANIKAVDGVSSNIYKGETMGLVGESGCGKTTMGRVIVGLEKPTEGKVFYKGREISNNKKISIGEDRTKIQMIFQDPLSSLNPRKKIYDILYTPLHIHNIVEKNEIDNEIVRLLDIVGLPANVANRYPHEFSGGQIQRIGIARALAVRPELIICDEAVSALDVSVQAQILNLLKELQEKFAITYVFIGHGLGAVKYISDRISVMYLGRIVEAACATEIFNNPKHPYTMAMLDATPIQDPEARREERIVLHGDVPESLNIPSGCRFHPRCPYAIEECTVEDPQLEGVEHKVACIRAEEIEWRRQNV